MIAALLLATLSIVPQVAGVVDEVDLAEVNHFHDEQGRLVFDQIIFYEWRDVACRYQVRTWRMFKNPHAQTPRLNHRTGLYEATWIDTQNHDVLRTVRSVSFRESFTQYDPELVEREFLSKEKRRDLSRVPVVGACLEVMKNKLGIQKGQPNE